MNLTCDGAALLGESFEIAIIGGGYTGAVLALHLLRRVSAGTRIAIIEPRADVGSGVAYATPDEQHRINVPADRMGVSAAPQDRFDIWLKTQHPELIGDSDPERTYVPRRWFGIFVRDRLADTMRTSAAVFWSYSGQGHICAGCGRRRRDRSQRRAQIARAPCGGRSQPWIASLATRHSRGACGNAGLSRKSLERRTSRGNSARWLGAHHRHRIDDGRCHRLASRAGPSRFNHRNSRHGLLPRKSGPAGVPPGLDLSAWPPASVAHYVKSIRAEMDRVEAEGLSWRGVFTALACPERTSLVATHTC